MPAEAAEGVAEVVEATHAHIRDVLGSLEALAHRRAVERAAVASAEHEIAACPSSG
jgi:hypothetical protein